MIKYLIALNFIASTAGISAMQPNQPISKSNNRQLSRLDIKKRLIAQERLKKDQAVFESMFKKIDPELVSFDQYKRYRFRMRLFNEIIQQFN